MMTYPRDVEIFMDAFVVENPGASWQDIIRAFERAMMLSMREGGELFQRFEPHDDRER
jgi:hypothetical protein